MAKTDATEKFWLEACATCGIDPATDYQVWFFGNSEQQARELAELVIAGTKTATASVVEFNDQHPEVAPISDGFSVVTDFFGEPMCVIQTTEIRHLPFREVDAAFAYDEGEGDRTLEDWRQGHWAYFSREGIDSGYSFDERTLICCERFRLIFPRSSNSLT